MPTLISTAPSIDSYSSSSTVYYIRVPISANTPSTSGGLADTWSISPALPAGLSMSMSDGRIIGVPTAAVAAADFTVTASNSAGSSQFILSIAVINGDDYSAMSACFRFSYHISCHMQPRWWTPILILQLSTSLESQSQPIYRLSQEARRVAGR